MSSTRKELSCSYCGGTVTYNKLWKMHRCDVCSRALSSVDLVKVTVPPKNKIKRQSIRDEKRAARDLKMTRTAASGATPFKKGDMCRGEYMVELKSTAKKEYRISGRVMSKLELQALRESKSPLLIVFFRSTGDFTAVRIDSSLEPHTPLVVRPMESGKTDKYSYSPYKAEEDS